MLLIKVICYSFALLFTAHSFAAKENMNWAVVHWPPLMILQGEDEGKGRFDIYLKLFQQHMPQYQHTTQETNWSRLWNDIKQGRNICNVLSLKTAERTKFAHFSKATSVTPSNRIIMDTSTFSQLGNPQSLSLKTLMRRTNLTGAIEKTRSYTFALDHLISQNADDSNIEKLTVNPENLLKMLLAKRFDYLLEYPYIAAYLAEKNNQAASAIKSVKIQEIEPYSSAYLACPNTAWGKQRITDFNKVIDKLNKTQEYLETMQLWYLTEQEKQEVLKAYQALQ